MRIFLIITVISAGLALAGPAYSYYTITLNNGEELQAEDYKFEGDKISLKLKTGTAAFPKMLVKAITGTGAQGSVNINTIAAPEPQSQPAQPAQPRDISPGSPGLPLTAPPEDGDIPDAEEGDDSGFPPDEEGEEEVILPEDETLDSEEGLDEELDLEGTEEVQ